jgi:plastocyanin
MHMRIPAQRRLAMLGGLAVAVAAACPSPLLAAEASAKAAQVAIRNFAFSPKTLTVRAGTRVTWTNNDEEPHVITSAGGGLRSSAALDTDDSYAVTFSKPGTYAYYCAIHPMMVGTVVVQ